VGQLLIDKTKLTPARILVLFVTSGAVLAALGIYQKVVDIGGAGATVPLTGFGYTLAKGVFRDVDQYGLIGAFTGGIKAAAAGIRQQYSLDIHIGSFCAESKKGSYFAILGGINMAKRKVILVTDGDRVAREVW
jgi:stage V sporulation protein AE